MSRDRGKYAATARKGAPQAQQIADKFHIVKNLRDGLKDLMARKKKCLPEVEEVIFDGVPLRARGKRRENVGLEGPETEQPEKHWRLMSKELRHSSAETPTQTLEPSRSQISRPTASLAMKPFDRFISKRSPNGKWLDV